MSATTIHFSIVNYSSVELRVLRNGAGQALLDLYGTFHKVPDVIASGDKPYNFTLEASTHAIGGFVYYKHDQPSEVLAVMACAAAQDDIKNIVKCVSTPRSCDRRVQHLIGRPRSRLHDHSERQLTGLLLQRGGAASWNRAAGAAASP